MDNGTTQRNMTDAGHRALRQRIERAGCFTCQLLEIVRGRNRNLYRCNFGTGPKLNTRGECTNREAAE